MNAFTVSITEVAQRELTDVVQHLSKHYGFNYLEAMQMIGHNSAAKVLRPEKQNTYVTEPVSEPDEESNNEKKLSCYDEKQIVKIQTWWRGILKRKRNKNEKIKKWILERRNRKNKGKIDILPKKILRLRYESFRSEVLKQLETEMEFGSYIGRIPNFPESISENIVLYILRHLGEKCTWKCTGDILVGETDTQGEVKCHFNGPSQFSPNKNKDGHTLFYLEAEDHIYNCGHFKLYKIENYNTDLKKIKINKNSLLEDQQDSGRRPRCVFKQIWPNIDDKMIWEGTIYDLLK
jgi:hypothetical protein